MADDQAPVVPIGVKDTKPLQEETKKSKRVEKKKKSSKPIVTVRHMQMSLPVLDAGLALLENVKKAKPYAQAARVLTGAAAFATASDSDGNDVIIAKLRTVRGQMIAFESAPDTNREKIQGLRAQMDTLVDLLLERA